MRKQITILMNGSFLHHFAIRRQYLPTISIIVLLAFLNLTVGCNYYMVRTHKRESGQMAQRTEQLREQRKVFIVHFGDDAWWLKNIMVSEDQTELYGTIDRLPSNRYTYLQTDPNRVQRYKSGNNVMLQEVHIYATEYAEAEGSGIIIPFSAFEKIEVYDQAQGATVASWVFGTIGVALGAFVVIMIIFLLTKSSCPFIYTFNGEHFVFTGEIFSGAIQPGLERNDYLRLPDIQPKDGEYLIKVANEIREIQHINLMELKVIDHPADTEVLFDKYGQVQTIAEAQPPITAETFSGVNITSLVSAKDSYSYYFDDAAQTDSSLDGIILTFEKPAEATEAKLIVRAKNSFWLENVINNFHEMFGRRYDAFSKKEEKKKPAEMRELMQSQSLPLSVYIEKDGEWEFQDFYEIAGPMAMKDDVLTINLEDFDSETINIRLESGFLFWELDYVAMDFTGNIPFELTTLSVSEAIDENGADVSDAIRYDDQVYYVQPEIGNEAILSFEVPEFTDESRTVILHSKGYYKILRDLEGRADWKNLRTFRQPGRMPQFSKELYEEMIELTQHN